MVSFGDEDINKLTEREVLSILKSKKDAFTWHPERMLAR